MKITPQVLSIPPYFSTTWENIIALKPEVSENRHTLTITLKTGDQVIIPALNESEVRQILEAHAQYTETQTSPFAIPFSFSLPLKQQGTTNPLGESMQHNDEQANLPDIPPKILHKMAIIAKAFGLDDHANLEPAKPNCNCMYCQLRNTIVPPEEIVHDEDLIFRDWEVKEVAHPFYSVISPLDTNEQYSVFLSEPIGCTCGHNNCEHIKAVLHS